jgi:hypothetical protein
MEGSGGAFDGALAARIERLLALVNWRLEDYRRAERPG